MACAVDLQGGYLQAVWDHREAHPLRFDWFFFDAEGEVKKPEFTPDPKKPAAASSDARASRMEYI